MQASSARYRRFLGTYLASQRTRMAVLAMLMLLDLALQLGLPRVVQTFIDSATGGTELRTLLWIGVAYLAVAIGQNWTLVGWQYVAQNIGLIATNRIRADLTLHCLQLDMGFHNARTPGELIERVDGDVTTMGNFFSRFVITLLGNGLLLIGVLVLLWTIDWRVGVAVTLFTALALIAVSVVRNVGVPHWNAARQAHADLFGFLEERLAGTEDLRASGATAYALRRLHEQSQLVRRKQVLTVA